MKRNMKSKIIKLGVTLMLLSCVSACGQKGKLYLPDEASVIVSDFSNTA